MSNCNSCPSKNSCKSQATCNIKNNPNNNIKKIIAVMSGKGGVGKSTISTNLAISLANSGARVGILDADIYGPSQPHLLNLENQGKPEVIAEKTMQPMLSYGVQSMSIGYLVDQEMPMVWRGPMISSALQQLLKETNWDNLDYLIVDLPPGTGDIALTLAKHIPVAGAVVVTTPQDLSYLDALKALNMFTKLGISILGVIENMSLHKCSNCGFTEAIFGGAGGDKLAEKTNSVLLGSLPLDKRICDYADSGVPIIIAEPNSDITKLYQDITNKLLTELSKRPRSFNIPFKNIETEDA